MKIQCSKCHQDKDTKMFYKDSRNSTGLQSQCRKCLISGQSKHYHDNKDEIRKRYKINTKKRYEKFPESRRKVEMKRYGITPEQYDLMLLKQNSVCAICKMPESKTQEGRIIRLSIDHDHKCCPGNNSCGKCVRGLLCHKCNTAIGSLNDDPNNIRNAMIYLCLYTEMDLVF